MLQNLLEKLQLKEEKNILIQGLPSSIEKQFVKINFAKNVTPLLKIKKIDFALVFAISENQLKMILKEVLPALSENGKFWIAYPKVASKIATDLNRDCSWNCIRGEGFETVREVPLDHVWTALRFKRSCVASLSLDMEDDSMYETVEEVVQVESRVFNPPADFIKQLRRSKNAYNFFETLSFSNKNEYVNWISAAKREDTRSRRLEMAIDKLNAGKRNPSEK